MKAHVHISHPYLGSSTRPQDRLSLEQCLRSAWVLAPASPAAPARRVARPVAVRSAKKESRIRLPLAPKNVEAFKNELDAFSLRRGRPLKPL